jgi:hypothetical protein
MLQSIMWTLGSDRIRILICNAEHCLLLNLPIPTPSTPSPHISPPTSHVFLREFSRINRVKHSLNKGTIFYSVHHRGHRQEDYRPGRRLAQLWWGEGRKDCGGSSAASYCPMPILAAGSMHSICTQSTAIALITHSGPGQASSLLLKGTVAPV